MQVFLGHPSKHKGGGGMFQTIQNSALVGVGGHYYAPDPFIPGEKPRTHLYRGLGGPRGGMEGQKKSRRTLGFDPRTVQPMTCRYADWAIPAAPRYSL